MPTKKNIIPLVLIATAAIWFFLSGNSKHSSVTHNQREESESVASAIDANKDSDGDGLKDWEEIIWNTNPYAKDTDSDGLPDDVEVAERKKTKTAAVGTETATGSVRNIISQTFPYGSTPVNTDTNVSQMVMEQFMQEFLKAKYQERAVSTPIDKGQLASLLFEKLKTNLEKERANPLGTFISRKEIKILSDNSPELTRTYLNELGMMFLTADAPDIAAYDIIREIAEQDDENFEFNIAHIRRLREHSMLYLSYATRMRNMQVPTNLASAHVDMMNSFIRTSIILEDVMHVEFDPLKGFAAVGAYADEVKNYEKPLKVFVEAITQQKISFDAAEGGMVFAQYTSKY